MTSSWRNRYFYFSSEEDDGGSSSGGDFENSSVGGKKMSKNFKKISKYFQVTDLIDFKPNGKVFLVFFYPGVSGRRVWWRFWGEIGMKII